MIGCTKLLCGTATVSDAVKYRGMPSSEIPATMLQFSTESKPLVVWNMSRRCNLRCMHCYIKSEDKDYTGELTTEEAKEFIDDLAEHDIPVLLFSGGEPLLRKDFYELAKYASDSGIRAVVSTNGTLITKDAAKKMKEAGIEYVGISLDGGPETHNKFRGQPNAFEKAIEGIKNAMDEGLRAGVRFTLNQLNFNDLDEVIDIVVKEGIPRFCMYHLVYAGRGKEIENLDVTKEQSREVIEKLMKKSIELHDAGVDIEIITTDNHADGAYIYNYVLRNEPERADEVMELLKMHGGCSAGHKFANVDNLGDVHACQFWGHKTLGNVRERKFSEIWNDPKNEFLQMMREKPKHLKGKCGVCKYNEICGGCRIRAESVTGDLWEEDPQCYLNAKEIG
ncbi:MAG: radical SAM protein [Candidatus Hydrothermarchaeaceae archaeon]